MASQQLLDHGDGIFELPQALTAADCEAAIALFESEPGAGPGVIHRPDGEAVVDAGLKRSTDYRIGPESGAAWLDIDRRLGAAMQRGVGAYVRNYPWLPKLPTTFCGFQVQRTEVGQGFDWHIDEDSRRRLALIFYLNDGFEGGETEFQNQGFVYTPRAGSLLMFPPFWTHPHRGREVTAGIKYIVTSFLLHER